MFSLLLILFLTEGFLAGILPGSGTHLCLQGSVLSMSKTLYSASLYPITMAQLCSLTQDTRSSTSTCQSWTKLWNSHLGQFGKHLHGSDVLQAIQAFDQSLGGLKVHRLNLDWVEPRDVYKV